MILKNKKNHLIVILFILIISIGSYLIINEALYIFNTNRKIYVDEKIINKINDNMKILNDNVSLVNNLNSNSMSNEDLEIIKNSINVINKELIEVTDRFKFGNLKIIEYYDMLYNKDKLGNDEYNSLLNSNTKKIKNILEKYTNDETKILLDSDSNFDFFENIIEKKSAYYSISSANYEYFKNTNKYILNNYNYLIEEYINLSNMILLIGRK